VGTERQGEASCAVGKLFAFFLAAHIFVAFRVFHKPAARNRRSFCFVIDDDYFPVPPAKKETSVFLFVCGFVFTVPVFLLL
jgi:hypothetical protein